MLYRKELGTCLYCEMGDTPDRVEHSCEDMREMAATFVPVVPCEHGNIDRHCTIEAWVSPYTGVLNEGVWCPGAVVGEDTP